MATWIRHAHLHQHGELVVHLATADIWFLDSIERGTFEFDNEAAKRAESRFSGVSDVAAFYQTAVPERLAAGAGGVTWSHRRASLGTPCHLVPH